MAFPHRICACLLVALSVAPALSHAASGEDGPGCRAWNEGRTGWTVNSHGLHVASFLQNNVQGLNNAKAGAEAAALQVLSYSQGSCSVSGLGSGDWQNTAWSWSGGWFVQTGTEAACLDTSSGSTCVMRRNGTYTQQCSVGGPTYSRNGAVTVTRQGVSTYSEDCGDDPECGDTAGDRIFAKWPPGGGALCVDGCGFVRDGVGVQLGANPVMGHMSGTGQTCAVGDVAPETGDVEEPAAEYCRTVGGVELCTGSTGTGQCGYLNDEWVCLSNVPQVNCWTTPDGGRLCGEYAPTPPVPDTGTSGQPAPPDLQLTTETQDGQSQTVNYYSSSTVNNSSRDPGDGLGTQPTGQWPSGGTGEGTGEGDGDGWDDDFDTGDLPGLPFEELDPGDGWSSGLGSGSCPADRSFSYGGQTMAFSFADACWFAGVIRYLVLAFATLTAGGILVGVRSS